MLNRFKNISLFLLSGGFIITLSIYLQSCTQDFVETGSSDLPADVAAVFTAPVNASNVTCSSSGCHDAASRKGDLEILSWNSVMKGSVNGTMVIPYSGFWSHLTQTVNSDTLVSPVADLGILNDVHKISADKVQTVLTWINNGAKNKDGNTAYNSVSPKVLITNQASDYVAVVYPNNGKFDVTRLIPVGGRPSTLDAPHYIITDPAKSNFFVSLISEGYVEKHSVSADYPFTIGAGDRLAVGLSPAHIEISPDGQFGYVSNFDATGTERRVKKFSTSPMALVDTAYSINMNAPHGLALTPDGQYLFASSQIGEYLFKITTSDMEIEMEKQIDPSVPPGGNGTSNFRPYQIILSPDGQYLFVSLNGPASNSANDLVRVFRASDLSFVNDITVGNNPILMKITPDGQYMFVCNKIKNSANKYTVSIINVASRTLAATVEDVGVQPHGVDFTPDGQYAIISCETQDGVDTHHPTASSTKIGVCRVIKIAGFQLLQDRVEMGSYPAGIVTVP